MKKIIYLLILGLMFGFYSCKEDKDRLLYNGPTYVSFLASSSSYIALKNQNNAFPVELGVTTSSTTDRQYTIEINTSTSTAIEGQHFEISSKSVTIPAGKFVGEVIVTPHFDALPETDLIVNFKLVAQDTAQYSIMSHSMKISKYCPLTIDDFVGTFNAVETRSGVVRNITVLISKENANTLRVNANAGIPGFLRSVFIGWGETFVNGFGLNGDILMHVGLNNGTITFDKGAYWGRTDAVYDYWYTGSGTWSGCAMKMNISFKLHWDNLNFDDAGDRSAAIVIDLNRAP
jgi:hypothetical protein